MIETAVSRMNAASPSIVRERLSVSFAAVLELDGFEVVAVVVDVSGDAVLDAVSAFVVAGVWVGASEDGDEASDGATSESSLSEEPGRKPRRATKPGGEADRAKRAVKGRAEPTVDGANAEVSESKAPAKRVRKAGTTDAAAN